tara:strand:- start:62433 stop:63314 length:882 start_codon:yes stop_codon:yes gene_type:complete
MDRKAQWRQFYEERNAAMRKGEETAIAHGFTSPPVDVFQILHAERRLIYAAGEDFGNAFDGRIRYLGNRFLLCYNTKYNRWRHRTGQHHSRVLFSIAHELGHYYLDDHRAYLVSNLQPHESFSEFSSHKLIEQQADHFAAGLLMPRQLLKPHINKENFPEPQAILDIRSTFNVSLTGLLARWAQLTDFPCVTIGTFEGRIQFGWVSESLRDRGCYRVRRDDAAGSRSYQRFVAQNSPVSRYVQHSGDGDTEYWLESDRFSSGTTEHYFAIPHTGFIWVFLICDEHDLSTSWDD